MSTPAPTQDSDDWRGRLNVLLVDDQPDALTALEGTLADLGETLITARSGDEALRVLLRERVAVILLDVVMPGMDGLETAEIIRKRSSMRDVPIIFLTALSHGEMPTARAYSLGAVDYLAKPVEPHILRSKVAAVVELARKTEIVRMQAERLREIERVRHEEELAQARERLALESARLREANARQQMLVAEKQPRWMR